MRFALFYHSVISDWNHGNAHFLRGMMRALQARGHQVVCYEPADAWSVQNLLAEKPNAIEDFEARFPDLQYVRYRGTGDFAAWLRGADAAIVHEWNEPELVARIGRLCRQLDVRALFHDTHYRVVQDEPWRERMGLASYDLILAYSPSIAERYRALGFRNVVVWHEAADVTVFGPRPLPKTDDVVFVGNYGDGDRSRELEEYVFGPRLALPELRYAIHGVRYPADLLKRLSNGLRTDYRGWVPNVEVPDVFARAKVALHIPRRQYVELLPGTPTIRVFEALACGACLVSLPWPDTDGLFEAGRDYAVASTAEEMRDTLARLCADDAAREAMGAQGRATILARHTCGHRADELLEALR